TPHYGDCAEVPGGPSSETNGYPMAVSLAPTDARVAPPEPRPARGLEAWLSDIRYSVRSLLRVPAFSCAIIGTLALCIGANTAILSTLYGLLLKPLPVPGSAQVIEV